MQFTQEQARIAAGVSTEALRHWRRAVPYLAEKSGKAARFSFADLIGLAVTREITAQLGVGISSVGQSIDHLFRVLDGTPWHALAEAVIVLRSGETATIELSASGRLNLSSPTIVIPCRPVLDRVRDALLPGAELDPQGLLPFPLQAVKAST